MQLFSSDKQEGGGSSVLSADERTMVSFNESSLPQSPSAARVEAAVHISTLSSVCSAFRHVVPSTRTLRDGVSLLADAVSELSLLGRTQVALLMANLIATFVVVYIVSSQQHSHMDFISLSFGLEFIILTLVMIVYTVCVENTFAFYGLIFLEVEVAAFVTTSAVVGVLTMLEETARWGVVAMNWASIILFLLLQRIVRRSWGWHALHLAGTRAEAVRAYQDYQQFAAVLLLDVFHSVFFVTAEEVVKVHNSTVETTVTFATFVGNIVFARMLQMAVRYERKGTTKVLFALFVVSLTVHCYFAILGTQRAILGTGQVADGDGISSAGERILVACVEWCAILVRCTLLYTIVCVHNSFPGALLQMFPRRTIKTQYIIDDEVVQEARLRAASTVQGGSSGAPIRATNVKLYDASGRAQSVLTGHKPRPATASSPAPSSAAISSRPYEFDVSVRMHESDRLIDDDD